MIKLTPWKLDYATQLQRLANNSAIAQNLTNTFPHPFSVENAVQFITRTVEHQPTRIFAIQYHEDIVGSIGLYPQTDIFSQNAELGYWVGEPYWGKGIVTAAILEMVAYGFANLPINRIFARPFGTNKASQRVLEKAGFVLEATLIGTIVKNDIVHDELIYAIRKGA
jgi:RimJ/RimL family protein N-acetyltransferase